MFALFLFGISSVQTVEATLQNGLVSFIDKAQSNTDLSGNGNDISCFGSQSGTLFDGIDDYCVIQSNLETPKTTSIKFKTPSTEYQQLLGKGYYNSGEDMKMFTLSTLNGNIHYELNYNFQGYDNEIAEPYNVNQEYIVTTIIRENIMELYVDGTLVGTRSAPTGFEVPSSYPLKIGNLNGVFFNGQIENMAIYDRALTQSEVIELYSNGGVPQLAAQAKTEQAYSQSQLSDIAINDTDWHAITAGNFTIEENDTINYGEVVVFATSSTDNMIISCRTNLDGVNGTVENKLILQNGSAKSNILLRNNVTLSAGTHNISLECKNEIMGNTIISASVGIGHIMKTAGGEGINYKNHQFANTINSGATFTQVGSTIFTANKSVSDNKYILVDWSAQINNTHIQDQTISVYPRIENIINNKSCEQNKQFIKEGEFETVGGICKLKVNELLTNTISLHGTGIATDYTANFNIKELDYVTENETKTNILTGITSNSATFIEKASTTFTSKISNAEVIVKGSISATSLTDDILFGQIQVLDETQTLTYTSKEIAINTNSNSNDITFQLITPIKSGINTFKLLLKSSTGNLVNIDSGEINGYVVQKLDIQDSSFQIKAFEFWNGTQLSNFSAVVGDTTYSTTGDTINAIGKTPFQDILINKELYVSRLYPQHDTTLDLNASIGQNRLDVRASETYTNNNINNFTLQTEIGNFSTTSGLITLYPLAGIYNWNITTDTYFNKTNEEFQVGGTLTEITKTNFYDTNLSFQDNFNVTINPNCDWIGNPLNNLTGFNLAKQTTLNSSITCSLLGLQETTFDLSILTNPISKLFTMNRSKIIINLYDRSTSTLITDNISVELIGPSGFTGSTITGILEIEDILFKQGEYRVTATTPLYESETGFFTYNAQEIVQKDLYLLKTAIANLGTIKIVVQTQDSKVAVGATVNMLQWDSITSSFKKVSQGSTNDNGEVFFNVELKSKVYIFQAELGALSASSSDRGSPIAIDGDTQTLKLSGVPGTSVYFLDNVEFSVTEDKTLRKQNISQIDFEVTNSNGLVSMGCINYYDVTGFSKTKWENHDICVESDKFIIQTESIPIDTNRSIQIELTIYSGGIQEKVATINYVGDQSFSTLFNALNIARFIIFSILILLLGIGMTSGNISLIVGALFGNMILITSIFPTWITGGLTAILGVLALGALYGAFSK
jgi:hypothetical protein